MVEADSSRGRRLGIHDVCFACVRVNVLIAISLKRDGAGYDVEYIFGNRRSLPTPITGRICRTICTSGALSNVAHLVARGSN